MCNIMLGTTSIMQFPNFHSAFHKSKKKKEKKWLGATAGSIQPLLERHIIFC